MHHSGKPSSGGSKALLVILLVMAGCGGLFWVVQRDGVTPDRIASHRPVQVDEDGYVSSDTCRACHPSEYASWHRSYHRTMTQVATPDTAVPDFANTRIDNVYGSEIRL